MSKILAILLFGAALVVAETVEPYVQYTTLAPGSARYEIVQGMNGTLRLDRYSGKIASMVSRPAGWTWEEVEVPGLPDVSLLEPRFQLTHMANSGDTLLLLDFTTGQTWTWERRDPRDYKSPRVWKPFTKPPTGPF